MNTTRIQVFSIDRYWKRCTIWEAGRNHQVIGRSTITVDKGVARPERYRIISAWLTKDGLKCPAIPATQRHAEGAGEVTRDTLIRLLRAQLEKTRKVLRQVLAAGETSDDMLEELEIEISNSLAVAESWFKERR